MQQKSMSLAATAVEIAIGELGKEEMPKGSNWGEHVKKYLASVGINFPAAWCMAYVHWCYQQAAKLLALPDQLPKTGGVLNCWNKVDKSKKFTTPQAGDICIMDFGKGLGHTFIVERVEGAVLHTIEGNSNDEGSREGYEVCRRTRPTTDKRIKGYIRL